MAEEDLQDNRRLSDKTPNRQTNTNLEQPLDRKQICRHLKSAVEGLTPDIIDRIDLTTPQEQPGTGYLLMWKRRARMFTAAAAACLCMIVAAGGTYTYENQKVDSLIGIDVNPSVELAINRKNRVLSAEALNGEAMEILDDMDLEGVDLNVAVNAVIGSMVKHGYLDDLDNAILVTVSNDSISKASGLRQTVVSDIQTSLEENQVKAVVYDQQAVEMDEIKALASEYGISYGKAYFLRELIQQNSDLTMGDMEYLSGLTMEEIANEISDRSYALGNLTDKSEETTAIASSEKEEATAASDTLAQITQTETSETVTTEGNTQAAESSASAAGQTSAAVTESITAPTLPPTTAETSPENVTEGRVKIDYTDYEKGVVTVNFATSVKWKNPTVSVMDGDGNTYASMVGDTDSTSCQILVGGLEGGGSFTFVIGGVSPKNGKPTTVKGSFETPVISEEATEPAAKPEPTAPQGTEDSTKPSESSSSQESTVSGETTAPQTTVPPATVVQTTPPQTSALQGEVHQTTS